MLYSKQPKCEVCGDELNRLDSLSIKNRDYTVCHSLHCRSVMSHKSIMLPSVFKPYLEFNKRLIRQRRESDAARKKQIEEMTEKERLEGREILQTVLHEHPEFVDDDIRVLSLLSGHQRIVPVASKRVNKYMDHLRQIVGEAEQYSYASEVVYDEHQVENNRIVYVERRFEIKPVLRTISDDLCTICKGGCCFTGSEHAYLSVYSVKRYMDENPDLSAEDVLELYLSNICLDTIENSCINHTERGCALPRHLRSAICNGFYCDPLKSYQQDMVDRESLSKVLAIQRSYTTQNRFEPAAEHDIFSVTLLDEYCLVPD